MIITMHYYTYESNLRDRNKFTPTVNTTYGTRRYFSSLDTEIYFGSQQIDEIVAFDFTVSEPKLPLYGFNSFHANRVISGRRMIQGTFAINFTHTNNMIKILRTIEDSIIANEYDSIVYRCEGDDTTGLGIGNSPVFDKTFDITVSYGYGKTSDPTYNGCYQTLVGVQIVEYRQALDTDGNPILDMYSFIAQDVQWNVTTEASSDINSENAVDDSIKDSVEIRYQTVNGFILDDYNNLVSACKGKQEADFIGFVVYPGFNMSTGQLELKMDALNYSYSFEDIKMTINNQEFSVNNMQKGSVYYIDMTGSNYKVGSALATTFKDPNASVDCAIEFIAQIDNEKTKINYKTVLLPLNKK